MKKTCTLLTAALFLCMALPTLTFSQTDYPNLFYNNGAVVYVQSAGVLHVQGDVVNASGSTFTNNGLLNVEGDFTNNATFQTDGSLVAGDGTVRFVGNSTVAGLTTGVQTISGTTTPTFHNMVVDLGTPGQVVALNTNVSVSGALVWNGATTTASPYFTAISSTYLPVHGTTPAGNGIINMYTGTSDYELYLSNPDPASLQGYHTISAFSYTGNPAALTSTANDGYISFRGVDGITAGFARQADRSATYVFPVGSPNRTYNPVKIHFTGTPAVAMKLSSKFTEYSLASTSSAFSNTFDQSHSASPANHMNLTQYPIDYTNNPGFNIFQQSTCATTMLGNWLIMDKVLKTHGYWSFSASPALAGTTYTMEAYPHGYTEWVTNGTDPNKRLLLTSTGASFSSVPTVANYQTDIETSIGTNYSDLITYSYFKNHKNLTASCNDADGVTGGRYSAFGHYSIGTSSNNNGNALPVQLIDLTATAVENSYIRVDWATASEVDNKGFDIMRSEDGQSFTTIGWTDGHGSTNEQHNYSYNDKTVQPGITYYYKLNQVDNDGKETPTNIVSAEITDGPTVIVAELQPNPTSGAAQITISTTDALPADIRFYDIVGQEIMGNGYQLTSGTNVIPLQTQQLASATYSVVIKVGTKTFSKKLVVVK